MKLVFSDDFAGTELDRSKWCDTFWNGSESDGAPPQSGEQGWYLPANVSVANSCLVLAAKYEPSHGYDYTASVVTTGRIGTSGPDAFSLNFPRGLMQARIRFPAALGSWCGFWCCAQYGDVPTPLPELDIIEYLGREPTIVNATFHNPDSGLTAYDGKVDLSQDFHVYSAQWSPRGVQWMIDSTVVKTFKSSSANKVPQYILLNFGVSKPDGWGGDPDPSQYPAEMLVDWVKVFRT